MLDILSVTLLEKTDFLSPSSCQLQIASRLGVGLGVHFLFFAGLMHAATVSVSQFMDQACVWKMLFPWSPPSLLALTFFLSLLLNISMILESRGLIKTSH